MKTVKRYYYRWWLSANKRCPKRLEVLVQVFVPIFEAGFIAGWATLAAVAIVRGGAPAVAILVLGALVGVVVYLSRLPRAYTFWQAASKAFYDEAVRDWTRRVDEAKEKAK